MWGSFVCDITFVVVGNEPPDGFDVHVHQDPASGAGRGQPRPGGLGRRINDGSRVSSAPGNVRPAQHFIGYARCWCSTPIDRGKWWALLGAIT